MSFGSSKPDVTRLTSVQGQEGIAFRREAALVVDNSPRTRIPALSGDHVLDVVPCHGVLSCSAILIVDPSVALIVVGIEESRT